MNYLLFDTCVWLNLADWRESEVLAALVELVKKQTVMFILPDIVRAEFERNEEEVLLKREKAAKSHIKQLRPWIGLLETEQEQKGIRDLLDRLNAQAGRRTEIAKKSTEAVKEFMSLSATVKTTEKLRDAAFHCCLDKKPPCHREKNNLADAVILEHFKEIDVSKSGDRRFFVTDNTEDFGGTDKRAPHEGLQALFDEKLSHYRTNVAEMLNEIQPGIVSATTVENVARLQEVMAELKQVSCEHQFDEKNGAYLRSRYGGITWHLRCSKCGALFDTGDHYD